MDTHEERHDGGNAQEKHPRGVYRFLTLKDSDEWRPASVSLLPYRARGEGVRDDDDEGKAEGQADLSPGE